MNANVLTAAICSATGDSPAEVCSQSAVKSLESTLAVAGLLAVFYLVYAELFLIGAIWLWCTAVHAAEIALFLLAVADAAGLPAVTPD